MTSREYCMPTRVVLGVLAALALNLSAAVPAMARDFTAGTLKVSTPWTRVTPPSAKVAGGFMTITNTGTVSDRLLGGTALISGRIEVHEMSLDGGIMKMRELGQGLEIKPGQTVELKPGAFHIMFMELKESPKVGTPVKGTLVFEKAGTIEIEYTVAPLGAKSADDKAVGGKATGGKETGGKAAGQHQHHHHGK